MAFQNFKTSQKIHFEIPYLKTLSQTPSSAVTIHKDFKGKLEILPFHLGYIKQAVKDLLDSKVSFYDIVLDGIVLGFNNIKVFNSACHTDSPKLFLDYTADVYLFRPTIKCVLKGIVNKKSPEHIGCLVNRAFNASICKPKEEHLIDNWEKMHSTVELGEPITFTVIHIDFSSTLPCINGSFCSLPKTEGKVNNASMSMDDVKNFSGEEENTNCYDPAGISELLVNCEKTRGLKKRKLLKSEVSVNDISLSPPKKKRKKSQIDVPSSDGSENGIFKTPTSDSDLQNNNNRVSPRKKLKGIIKNEKESEKMFKKKNSHLDMPKSDSNSVNFKSSSDESSVDSGNHLITSTLKNVVNSKKVSPKKELEGIVLEEKESKKALKKKKSFLGMPSKGVAKRANSQSSTEESLDDSRNSIINSALEQLYSKTFSSESSQEEVRNAGEFNKLKKKKSISVFNPLVNNGQSGKIEESPLKSKKMKRSTEVNTKEVQSDVDVSNLETNEHDSTPLKKKKKKEKSRLSIEDLKNSIIADRICKLSL